MKNSEEYKNFRFSKPITLKKTPKAIPRISNKKKLRLKEGGSELELFKQIALERSINGEVIAKDINNTTKSIKIDDLLPINFSHIVPKSKGEEYRLDKDNIEIISFALHFEHHTGLNYKGPYLPN